MLKKVGVDNVYYYNIEYDVEGWADAKEVLPTKFDLLTLKTQTKTISGWYTGEKWFGLRLRDYDNVLYWKRKDIVY